MSEKIYPGIKARPGPMSFLGVLMALAARPKDAPDVITRESSGSHRLHLTKYRPTRAQRKVRRRMQQLSRRRNRA